MSIAKNYIKFNEDILVEALAAIKENNILSTLLVATDNTDVFTFSASTRDIENAQINVIVEQFEAQDISVDCYVIKSIDDVCATESYDEYHYRLIDNKDERDNQDLSSL